MSIILPKFQKKETKTVHYQSVKSKNLLLVFTRNPVLGKCKTRLAATIGDKAALDIYKFLLNHTFEITKNLNVHKQVHYSEEIWENDIWDTSIFEKCLQEGNDLGERMSFAFQKGFSNGFKNIIIIGSDMYDISANDLETAFNSLEKENFVVGPAEDGGYYLLGMNIFNEAVFKNKVWGTNTVLKNTRNDLEKQKIHFLEAKNDIDVYEDLEHIKAIQPFLKKL